MSEPVPAGVWDESGLVVVDKPQGWTSHQVVARCRRLYGTRKVGHAGTLDPMATGVLLVGVGRATRLLGHLAGHDKTYVATIRLGEATTTDDAEGELISAAGASGITDEQVRAAVAPFVGAISQVPSAVSAIKVDGVKLYQLARKGEEIEREPRFIRVAAFNLLSFASPKLTFDLHCTKGTYVRTIAHDLGQKLGCGAHLSALRRTASGQFTIGQCLPLEEIEKLSLPEIDKRLIPVYEAAPRVAQ